MSWEEKFDDRFKGVKSPWFENNISEDIKAFIRKLLEEQSGYLLGKKIAEEEIKSQCADELEEIIPTNIMLFGAWQRFVSKENIDNLIKKWRESNGNK